MQIRVGCEFRYDAVWPTPTVIQVQPHRDGAHHILHELWQTTPHLPVHTFNDIYGNLCQRLLMPVGEQIFRYDALIEVSNQPDAVDLRASQMPIETLPDWILHYTLPSRFCLSDTLSDTALQLFGTVPMGWACVQAICDWVHTNIRFEYGTSTPLTTSLDVYERRVGVCRDFAHLAITFCRALNVPARYVFGYLPDVGVPPPDAPMDFCAWMEVYLDGHWWTFDPRNNQPRIGRIIIGRGRDALDVAMVTTYGSPHLQNMLVWADEVPTTANDLAKREDHTQA